MYPEIFHISFLHTYGVLVAVAFLTALWLAGRLARAGGPESRTPSPTWASTARWRRLPAPS